MNGLIELGKKAKAASHLLAAATTAQKNKALEAIAAAFESDKGTEILEANQVDLSAAKENGLSQALTDRLRLTPERLADISKGVREVAALPDPIGEIIGGGSRPNGLKIEKIRTPLGVVAMIFEARPNVTADAAALCLKSSNACILRCGKEAIHSTGRILLAEDNELNQEIAQAILEEAGFSVEIAGTGQEALDMLCKSQPGYYQLILMDIQMPEMNGYEATKCIRRLENPKLASIPILAMTANAFEEDKQAALKCGMNGHISKPIDISKLLETLESVLKIR